MPGTNSNGDSYTMQKVIEKVNLTSVDSNLFTKIETSTIRLVGLYGREDSY